MQDRLVVWLAVATAFTALVALVTVGLQPLALFGLVHVPAVLMLLLAGRAAVCIARGEPTALRIGSRQVLDGWLALLVPLLLLAVWTVGRETGTFGANLSCTSATDRVTSKWDTASADAPPGVTGGIELPATLRDATGIAVSSDGGVLQERAAVEVRALTNRFAGHRVVGNVDLQMAPPFALLPLWKSADASARVTYDLYLRDLAGSCRARIHGTIDGTVSCTMLGFASQRNFHEHLGAWLGKHVVGHLTEPMQKLAGSTR